MKHLKELVSGETPFETGERSTYMRYDAVEEMYKGQVKGFNDQAIKDGERNRQQLEELGKEAVRKLEELVDITAKMWRISEPHMTDK
ncbi:MAG: hypothetical protein PHX34_03655 [Candidatus Shapirobacteria bacterium]|nr:hypothetical protein [Candidatus Shapirobacteria bacterium]